eukprot:TRINITY_DN4684_c0_g1_i2.p1 TRINITY_DN4684_c0_g1~~TRINITY_DN4684_c0_g1_i2.p1  ORF type:complete len:720 (+),score=212.72 TRINITY_DN4684_c0_g1_i2:364-2523(+)
MDESYYLYGRIQYKVPRGEHWSILNDPYKSFSRWKFAVGDEVPLRVNFRALIKEKLFHDEDGELSIKEEGLRYARLFCELDYLEWQYQMLPEYKQLDQPTRDAFFRRKLEILEKIRSEGDTGIREYDAEMVKELGKMEDRCNNQFSTDEKIALDALQKAMDMPREKLHLFNKLSALISLIYLKDRHLLTDSLYNDLWSSFWPEGRGSRVNDGGKEFFERSHFERSERAVQTIDQLLSRGGTFSTQAEQERVLDVFMLTCEKHREFFLKDEVVESMIEHLVKSFMTEKEIEDHLRNVRNFEAATEPVMDFKKLIAMEVAYREAEYQNEVLRKQLYENGAIEEDDILPLPREYHTIHLNYGLKREFRGNVGRGDMTPRKPMLTEGELMNFDEQSQVKKRIAQTALNLERFMVQPGVSVDDVEIEKIRQKENAMIAFADAKMQKLKSNDEGSFKNDLAAWLKLEKEIYDKYINTNERKAKFTPEDFKRISINQERANIARYRYDKRGGGKKSGKWLYRWIRKIMWPILLIAMAVSVPLVFSYMMYDWYQRLVIDKSYVFMMTFQRTVQDIMNHPELRQHFDNLEPFLEESLLQFNMISPTSPSGPGGFLIAYPLFGSNGKKAYVTLQAYKKPGRQHMWQIYPVTVDLMNGKQVTVPIEKNIVDGVGLMNEMFNEMTEMGDPLPWFGLPNLFRDQSYTVEEQAIMRLQEEEQQRQMQEKMGSR